MEDFIQVFPRIAFRINMRYFVIAGMTFLIFYVFFKKKYKKDKIQTLFPGISDYKREVFFSLISMTIFAGIATLVFTVFRPYTELYPKISDYGWSYYVFSIVLMVFVHDFYFYWTHRIMHHPLLYRHVHLVHHKSTNPSPWTAYAFHPIEAIVEAGILLVIAFLVPAHFSAILLFFLLQIIYNVYGHLGFELYPKNTHKHPIGKWLNTSVSHNQHHQFFEGNYGLYFTIWDRLMGTLRTDYDEQFESVTNYEKKSDV
ncbi:MAG: sterol desaturase family protein [Saprospiraceae bacterium]|nr:sterol desaturase family protein [Saprospiraceae bacterium]